MSGRVLMGLTSTKLGLMCLAQGHSAVMPVRLEPTANVNAIFQLSYDTKITLKLHF